ncbi:expressed protein [Echinococcus multilocularis]|uniref:Expressed protein n=1 Tax=Echinococcus multilocularis TaxID=6211 RepID=A0A068Y6V5_ECHMU|nr:expressed protein [Echinococcus multilocularis]
MFYHTFCRCCREQKYDKKLLQPKISKCVQLGSRTAVDDIKSRPAAQEPGSCYMEVLPWSNMKVKIKEYRITVLIFSSYRDKYE